jgi:AcrR family transcriptional regulator
MMEVKYEGSFAFAIRVPGDLMKKPRRPLIAPRKAPSQQRSRELVADILEAAIRVLVREGGLRFNTVRVAKESGVSVGSLYQYFPNKEALLFRLQADEWEETWSILEGILLDPRTPPMERLRRVVLTFFRSEREEAALRVALDDAGALIRDAPEARAHFAKVVAGTSAFFDELLPGVPRADRAFAAEFVLTSMSSVAESITRGSRTRAEVDAWARASADMYCGYLERILKRRAGG